MQCIFESVGVFQLLLHELRVSFVLVNDAMFEMPGTENKTLTVNRAYAESRFDEDSQTGLKVA